MPKRSMRSLSFLGLLSLLVACAPAEISCTVTVQTEEASPLKVNHTAQNLSRRFEEMLPSIRSTVASTVTGNTITFTFRGEAPPEDILRPLALTRGVLQIAPADRPDDVWVTDADVTDVQMRRTDQGRVTAIRLEPEAGRRLLQATSAGKGRTLVMSWDGKILLSAPIAAPFGEMFELTGPSDDIEAHTLLNALRRGRLLVAVKSFDYRAAGPHLK